MSKDFEPLAVFMRVLEISEIATALEENGCYGYDRFGRYGEVKDIGPILDHLANFYDKKQRWIEEKIDLADVALTQDQYEEQIAEINSFPGDSFIDTPSDTFWAWQFGWPSRAVPKTIRSALARKLTNDTRNENATWQKKCRDIADQIYQKEAAAGNEVAITPMSERVAREAARLGILNTRGQPPTGSSILREALQGGRWSSPKGGDPIRFA